jgi:hypothetical protein
LEKCVLGLELQKPKMLANAAATHNPKMSLPNLFFVIGARGERTAKFHSAGLKTHGNEHVAIQRSGYTRCLEKSLANGELNYGYAVSRRDKDC